MTVEQRLKKLERSSRRWKVFGVTLLAAVVFLGADREKNRPVVTTELHIVNDAGDTVATFDEMSDRGRLRIWNEDGDLSLVFGATAVMGGVVMTYQPGGEDVGVVLYGRLADGVGGGQVVINDRAGNVEWWAPKAD